MATKKTTTKKTTITRKKIVNPLIGQNQNLHKLNIVLQLVLACLVLYLLKPIYYALSLSFVTKDALLSENQTVLVPAEKILLDLDIRWLMLALITASAIYSALVLSRWRASYEKAQNGRIYVWRWVFLAIGGGLMIKLATIVSGVEDMVTIKLSGGLMMLAMAFAWLSERQHEKATQPRGGATFWLSLISGLVAMYAIVGSLVGTALFGLIRFPWYVYALDAVVLLGFLFTMLNLRLSNRRSGQLNDYAYVERNYTIYTMLTQLIIVAIALVGFAG